VGCLLRLEPNKQAQVAYSIILHAIIPLHWANISSLCLTWKVVLNVRNEGKNIVLVLYSQNRRILYNVNAYIMNWVILTE
jgi:hypothetical protein